LDNLDPSVVGQPGSVIGPAIRQAREQLVAARGGADRAIVVLSDGEWFDGREAGIAEATSAAAAGLRVITVGFGTTRGTTIALPGGGVKQDEDGKTVVTKYDPAALKAIASAGNGQFIDANANDKASRVRGALSQLRAERRSVERAAGRTPRYQWFLLPAVLLLLLDAVGSRAGAATIRLPRRLATAAAAAVLVMMALWPRDVRADVLADAARDFRAGRFAEAARKLREAIAGGDQRPATIYNLGTALLAADSIGPAIDAFERAARGAPADVRQRALYNLGLAHLKRALQGGDSASAAAQQALAAYKQVLLATPSDAEARWNYELALKLKKDDSGASKPDPSPSAASPKPDPKGEPQAPSQALPKEQAQQLLDNAARDEKDTQGKKQKKGRPDAPPGGKDW
jgi:Ca-activated chloride channel family protein